MGKHAHKRHEDPRAPLPPAPQAPPPEEKYGPTKYPSPLGHYFRVTGLTAWAFSRAMGANARSVEDWTAARTVPPVIAALEIERLTKGVVPVEAWASLPQCRSQLAVWREHQPEAVRNQGRVLEPGGFAQPPRPANGKRESQSPSVFDEHRPDGPIGTRARTSGGKRQPLTKEHKAKMTAYWNARRAQKASEKAEEEKP